jgi:hypothetical protein
MINFRKSCATEKAIIFATNYAPKRTKTDDGFVAQQKLSVQFNSDALFEDEYWSYTFQDIVCKFTFFSKYGFSILVN